MAGQFNSSDRAILVKPGTATASKENMMSTRNRALIVLLYFTASMGSQASETEKPVSGQVVSGSEQIAEKLRHLPQAMLDQLLANMVRVEGGNYLMGTDSPAAAGYEKPAHKVTVDTFHIGKYEVTQDVFQQVMGWNVSYFPCAACPVNNVSRMNIDVFIERLRAITGKPFRLPSEAEWAYAARGGNQSRGYHFSGSDNIEEVAWYAGNSGRKNHPVGLKKPNELGLYDMTGNLWEICADEMDQRAYRRGERINPLVRKSETIMPATMIVTRGSGYEFSPEESYVYRRDGATANVRLPDLGFRLAL